MEIELTTLPNDDGISVRPAIRCPGCRKKLEAPTADDFRTGDYGCGDCGQSIDPYDAREALDNSPMNLRNDPLLRSGDRSVPTRGGAPEYPPGRRPVGHGGAGRRQDLTGPGTTRGSLQTTTSVDQLPGRPKEPDPYKGLGGGFGYALPIVAILGAALDLPGKSRVAWGLLIWALIGGVIGLVLYLQAWASYRRAMDDWLMTYAEGLANDAARGRLGRE